MNCSRFWTVDIQAMIFAHMFVSVDVERKSGGEMCAF